jgi:hypothetical protein
MQFIPRELVNTILLFSGHLVILEGKYHPVRKLSPERINTIQNILQRNPVETGWDVFANLVRYVVLDITIQEDTPRFYVISKYLTPTISQENNEEPIMTMVMITNTPYIYEDDY